MIEKYITAEIYQLLVECGEPFMKAEPPGTRVQWSGPLCDQAHSVGGVAKMIYQGVKIAKPTFDMCRYAQEVDIRLTAAEYKSPFTAFAVEFPDEYCKELKKVYPRAGAACPRLAVIWCEGGTLMLNFMCTLEERAPGLQFVLSSGSTIEDFLVDPSVKQSTSVNSGGIMNTLPGCQPFENGDQGLTLRLTRVALNYGLFLTHFGVNQTAKTCKHRERVLGQLRRSKRSRHRATLIKVLGYSSLDLAQAIKLPNGESKGHGGSSDCEGTGKKPHWRRGHWRMQAHGIGWSEHRLKFIEPILIHEDWIPDKSKTSYIITGGKPCK